MKFNFDKKLYETVNNDYSTDDLINKSTEETFKLEYKEFFDSIIKFFNSKGMEELPDNIGLSNSILEKYKNRFFYSCYFNEKNNLKFNIHLYFPFEWVIKDRTELDYLDDEVLEELEMSNEDAEQLEYRTKLGYVCIGIYDYNVMHLDNNIKTGQEYIQMSIYSTNNFNSDKDIFKYFGSYNSDRTRCFFNQNLEIVENSDKIKIDRNFLNKLLKSLDWFTKVLPINIKIFYEDTYTGAHAKSAQKAFSEGFSKNR